MTKAEAETPLLWQYNFSNFNEKVRWALDFKGIAHRRRSLLPGGPRSMAFSRKGTLPVLDLDRARIMDSTRIIEALERRFPDPPLFPADPDERRHALALEDFFDEHAGHDMRRIGFWELRNDRRHGTAFLATGRGRAARAMIRATGPLGWLYVKRRYGFDEESYQRSRAALVEALDRIEAERGEGDYLAGERFTVADLTAAALLFPLVWPPELQYDYPDPPRSDFQESVRDHPAVAWIGDTYRRHRSQSAEVT